jgi:hypothetical protein
MNARSPRSSNGVKKLWGRRQDVSVGSNTEVELADPDFRFTPQNRHQADIAGGPKSANMRHSKRGRQLRRTYFAAGCFRDCAASRSRRMRNRPISFKMFCRSSPGGSLRAASSKSAMIFSSSCMLSHHISPFGMQRNWAGSVGVSISLSTEIGCPREVRSAPVSNRLADIAIGPFRAMNRHRRCRTPKHIEIAN